MTPLNDTLTESAYEWVHVSMDLAFRLTPDNASVEFMAWRGEVWAAPLDAALDADQDGFARQLAAVLARHAPEGADVGNLAVLCRKALARLHGMMDSVVGDSGFTLHSLIERRGEIAALVADLRAAGPAGALEWTLNECADVIDNLVWRPFDDEEDAVREGRSREAARLIEASHAERGGLAHA